MRAALETLCDALAPVKRNAGPLVINIMVLQYITFAGVPTGQRAPLRAADGHPAPQPQSRRLHREAAHLRHLQQLHRR